MDFNYFKAVKNKEVPKELINWSLLDEQIEKYHLFYKKQEINFLTTTYPHSKVRSFIENLIMVISNDMEWSLKKTLKALEWDSMNYNNFKNFKNFKVVPIISFIKRLRFIRDYKYLSVTNVKIHYWIDVACNDSDLNKSIKLFFN